VSPFKRQRLYGGFGAFTHASSVPTFVGRATGKRNASGISDGGGLLTRSARTIAEMNILAAVNRGKMEAKSRLAQDPVPSFYRRKLHYRGAARAYARKPLKRTSRVYKSKSWRPALKKMPSFMRHLHGRMSV
jgi:hypothetical protein